MLVTVNENMTPFQHQVQSDGIKVTRADADGQEGVLTTAALAFIAKLEREFGERRRALLRKRVERQIEINSGRMPDFLSATEHIRTAYWKVADCPDELNDRRVEILSTPERQTLINALNSGANVCIADFEDGLAPTWENLIAGQQNLMDAVDRTISYPNSPGKQSWLNDKTAVLMMRPRGWHLDEKHVFVDGQPMSASLFDFGLFCFHNAQKLLDQGSGPYFYLAKIEDFQEARLWNDVFLMAQDELNLPRGSIRAAVVIESILAAFQMHEILYELRECSLGLSCGRWGYLFSIIKKFRHHPEFLLPDRARLTMMTHFLRSYSTLLIQTCHRHGAHAIGGMVTHIPVADDPGSNDEALDKVRLDKEREVEDGHDGTWISRPELLFYAKRTFDERMQGANQIHRKREDANITSVDLLTVPKGEISELGLRTNITVALRYLGTWLNGKGCVSINNLIEDAATAEIARAQLWQWVHSPNALFADHRRVNAEIVTRLFDDEDAALRREMGSEQYASGRYFLAASIVKSLVLGREFREFLTAAAYEYLD